MVGMKTLQLALLVLGALAGAAPAHANGPDSEAVARRDRVWGKKPRIGRIIQSGSIEPGQTIKIGRIRQSGSLKEGIQVNRRPRRGYGAL
jgi:hypothetical protein